MENVPRPHLPILTGPTGVGKTEVGVLVAERLGAEIVSADSMAVYRGMEAATAKPSEVQRERAAHHLIDVADPAAGFTVDDYVRAATRAIEEIRGRGRLPLLVGGTRLYLASLVDTFDTGPPPDPEYRRTLDELPAEELHPRLAAVDPVRAGQLHPSDRKRLTRALEIHHTTGIRPTELLQDQGPPLYEGVWAALMRPREELYARVDQRVEEMLSDGLVEEVEQLYRSGLTPESPAMAGHGYKEIMRALRGDYPMDEAIRLTKRNTRRYVKYQLMWLRGRTDVTCIEAGEPEETAHRVSEFYRSAGLAECRA